MEKLKIGLFFRDFQSMDTQRTALPIALIVPTVLPQSEMFLLKFSSIPSEKDLKIIRYTISLFVQWRFSPTILSARQFIRDVQSELTDTYIMEFILGSFLRRYFSKPIGQINLIVSENYNFIDHRKLNLQKLSFNSIINLVHIGYL